MNDSYTVQFGDKGWSAGTLFLANGQVSGGDNRFVYGGTYTKTGNVLVARVRVQRNPSEVAHVFVFGLEKYDDIYLDITGTIEEDNGTAIGALGGTVYQLNGTLTKQR